MGVRRERQYIHDGPPLYSRHRPAPRRVPPPEPMHRTRTPFAPPLAAALASLCLAGCGNKGDLFLPAPETNGSGDAAPVLPELEGAPDAPPGRPADEAPSVLPVPEPGAEGADGTEGAATRGRRRASP